jgi:hypothetical protein
VYGVGKQRTCWVFISDSNEPRHLHDIAFAVNVLEDRGVSLGDVHVFTDHHAPTPHLAPFGVTQIYPLTRLKAVFATLSGYEIAFVVVTGHGCLEGIGAAQVVISPHELLASVRSMPGISVGVVLLCQCFAGMFNLLDAKTKPELVLIGATNLNSSLSVSFRAPMRKTDGSTVVMPWLANLFMVEWFSWLKQPTDIDGDGSLTLLDAYKYAGAKSNAELVGLKSTLYIDATRLYARVVEIQRTQPFDQLAMDAAIAKLQSTLETLHLHQEPWLLHANLAREIGF